MQVYLTPSSKKDLKKLPISEQRKIGRKLIVLGSNPYSGKKLSGELESLYAIRAWPYRIIYEIDLKDKRIEVHKIRHRQGSYK